MFNIPDDDTVIDLTNLSQECKVIPKQEPRAQLKIEDNESVEDDNNPDKDQFGNIARTEKLGSTTNEDGLRRSNCNIRPPQVTQVIFQNKWYDIDGWNAIFHGTNHVNVDAWNRRGKVSGNKYVEVTMHVNVQYPALFVHNEVEVLEEILGIAMAQHLSIRAGLKKFGSKGEKAVSNELTQLHTMSTYYPVDPTTLTKKQKLDALNSLMFLIEKRNG